jgi:hypothetical protein
MGAPRCAPLLEGVEIAADGRFGDGHFADQFLDCHESVDADQFQKSRTSVVVLHVSIIFQAAL